MTGDVGTVDWRVTVLSIMVPQQVRSRDMVAFPMYASIAKDPWRTVYSNIPLPQAVIHDLVAVIMQPARDFAVPKPGEVPQTFTQQAVELLVC